MPEEKERQNQAYTLESEEENDSKSPKVIIGNLVRSIKQNDFWNFLISLKDLNDSDFFSNGSLFAKRFGRYRKEYFNKYSEYENSIGIMKDHCQEIIQLINTYDFCQTQKNIPSVFLSHSTSEHGELILDVAKYLGHLGILAWIDIEMILSGDNILRDIITAIEQTSVFVIFLSENSLSDSKWVEEEFSTAYKLQLEYEKKIIPVFMDKEDILAQSLRNDYPKWLNNSRSDLIVRGIPMYDNLNDINTYTIAEEIGKTILKRIDLSYSSSINLFLDQRGYGHRNGTDQISSLIPPENKNIPTFVFRSDRRKRSQEELMNQKDWEEFKENVSKAIYDILESANSQPNIINEINILGNYQYSLGFYIGKILRKESGQITINSFSADSGTKKSLSNKDLEKNDIEKENFDSRFEDSRIEENSHHRNCAIFIGTKKLLSFFEEYIEGNKFFVVSSIVFSDEFLTKDHLKYLIQELVLKVTENKNEIKEIYLFSELPYYCMPILASILLSKSFQKITLMEFDENDKYFIQFSI